MLLWSRFLGIPAVTPQPKTAVLLSTAAWPLLLLLTATGCHGDSGICAAPGANWEANSLTDIGLCIYTEVTEIRASYGYADCVAKCNSATGKPGLTRLPRINSEQKKVQLINALFKNGFGYLTVWTEAHCDITASQFVWSDGSPVAPQVTCSSADSRLYFSASLAGYTFVSSFAVASNSSLALIPVCEYDAPQCNASQVTGYNKDTMSLSTAPYANQTVRFNCASGYYRPSEIGTEVDGSSKKVAAANNNLFFCLYQPDSGAGTTQFVQIGTMNALEGCQPTSCQGWQLLNTTTIPDVQKDYKSAVDGARNYKFGEKIDLVCAAGYVNVTDASLTTANLVCGQSDLDPSLGMWTPSTLVVCTAIKCLEGMPFYDADEMIAYKAFDRLKDRAYSSDESNRFPYYPNEVSIKCRNSGNFFMDRTYDKALKCDLPGNGTNNSAIWFPFGGTVLSGDVMKCQPITCLTKEIVITTQQNDLLGYLSRSNFNDSLVTTNEDSDPVEKTMTIREFTTKASLEFHTKVKFSCQPGYLMSAPPSETGQSQLTNSTEVICSSSGTWNFKVASCIKKTQTVQITSSSGKYIPPAQEAAGAASLGLIVIIILIVFFSTILILDLTTITRDLKLLKTNLRRIKLRVQQGKQA